eukprot:TRINITY_DN2131_c0_g3_i1.p1 TRINITY_DN2131_c0_g3~~TRINITY_DN2131_c0_g3_i1.p1  ORF type:complete len:493 (+),score=46.47 TRINITY_DN2131_c0_g3_i1:52-1530(+)
MKLYLEDPLGWDAAVFTKMSEDIGLEITQMRFLLTIFGSFPLAFVMGLLPGGYARHFWAIFWGVASCLMCFQEDSVHPIAASAVTYLIVRTFPGEMIGFTVLVFSFLHMSAAHLYSYWYEFGEWNIDYTMAQMILTVKLQTFAYSVTDGTRDEGRLNPKSDQKRDRILPKDIPNPIEFLSYIFFFPTFIAGPAFTYNSYITWVRGEVKVPVMGRIVAAFWKFLGAIVIIFLNKVVSPMVPNDRIIEPASSGNPSLYDFPLPLRLVYIWISVVLTRTKYFLVWYLVDTSCILSGFGFNGKLDLSDPKNGKSSLWRSMFEDSVDSSGNLWNACSNGNYFKVEMATNIKGITDNWNTGVNNWLKNVVYFRLSDVLGSKSQAPVLLTQVTSAFWHGFYPGYYFFFVSASMFVIVARAARNKIRPLFLKAKQATLYDLITFVFTGIGANYIGVPFVFLDWRDTMRVWNDVYYAPHVMAVCVYLIATFIPKEKTQKKE